MADVGARAKFDRVGEELARWSKNTPPPAELAEWLGVPADCPWDQLHELAVLAGELWDEWDARVEIDLRSIGVAALGAVPADGPSFYRDMAAAMTATSLGELEALAICWDAADPEDVARRLWLALELGETT